MFQISIAMLINDTRKYLGIVLGLAFTSFMMALQPATFIGILDGITSQIDTTRHVDLWVMPPDVKSLDGAKQMRSQLLFRVKSIEGVDTASPYFKGSVRINLPSGETQSANLIGIDSSTMLGGPSALQAGSFDDFRYNDKVFVDWDNAKPNGVLSLQLSGVGEALQIGETLTIENAKAEIAGFHLGASAIDPMPTLYVNFESLRRYVSDDRVLSYVLVQLRPNADVAKVKAEINRYTGLVALTGPEFKRRTYNFVLWETGAYVSFGVITLIAFAVGGSIAAQSFAAFSRDNLRYFGVLKALGASKTQLLLMILTQAFIAALLGFGLGVGVVALFGRSIRDANVGFSFSLPWYLILFSAASVLLVCLLSASFSIRRVLKLEPAAVFK
jgi:putative ABC transport system permease protein